MDAFQSTPPCGGELVTAVIAMNVALFQSTPPCGGEQILVFFVVLDYVFQSTPPCGGELCRRTALVVPVPVSIHTPVRG